MLSILALSVSTSSVPPVKRWITSRFTVDSRALAAFRIALGLVILADLVHRAGDIDVYYTDAGVYPVSVFESSYPHYNGRSLHALSGDLWFQYLLFVVAGLFAVSLVLGYRTRLVAFLSFVLLFSLHARNPAVLNGADRLLRVLLLIAVFTPMGERWSIDALRRQTHRPAVWSFAVAALLIQPLAVFVSNAMLKYEGETWYSGDALELAMASDVMTVHLGNHIGEYSALLTVLTYSWVALLVGSVVLLLVPVGTLRAFVVLVYLGAFAGMAATMSVGWFPVVLSVAVVPFLPPVVWDRLERFLPLARIDSLFDGPVRSRLTRSPVERRAIDALRSAGYGSVSAAVTRLGRSSFTAIGVVLILWIVVFSGAHVAGHDVPDRIDNPHADVQKWGLYSPDPAEGYSWYVVEAELANGSSVDAIDGGGVSGAHPPDASQEYDTFRDRKYIETVRSSASGDSLGHIAYRYGEWACERAVVTHGDEEVETVVVHRLRQSVSVDGDRTDLDHAVMLERSC